MSFAAIGGAVLGGVVVGEYKKSQGEKQREAQKELTQEQAGLQRELTEQQIIERRAELLGRERGQEEAQRRAAEIGEQAQQQFMAATEGRPEQITRLQEIIIDTLHTNTNSNQVIICMKSDNPFVIR